MFYCYTLLILYFLIIVHADSRDYTEDLASAIESHDGLYYFYKDMRYPRAEHSHTASGISSIGTFVSVEGSLIN